MATASQPRSSTAERKTFAIVRPPSLAKATKNTTTPTGRTIDPSDKRVNNIRINLLTNRIHRKVTFAEPTLVFDKFLYLGGLKSLYEKNRATRLNITHVLSVVWIRPKKDTIPPNAKHFFIKAEDTILFDMTPYFEQACRFIEEARQSNGRVLVHCACGVSRSTTICCAYLMKHHSMSLEQALTQIRSQRPIVRPNAGFLRQLIRFNEKIECDRANVDKLTEKLENI
ncbi:unnamed protein product [Rotaria magnacalcarata]|uniref:protein-tyrosine-phosphatase n=2 Tax=Rotaria magnacalcarata TaxID=392030 RepID=A0A816W4G2_9BILA|nr:unnamed protein product [Rotaria magnacalcarata]CAF4204528.1 unnamed protein product [Rotaria magnacalcarata]